MPSIILEVIGTRTQASGHQSYDRTTRKWSCLAKEVFVWCKKGKAFNPKNTVGSILLRDFFLSNWAWQLGQSGLHHEKGAKHQASWWKHQADCRKYSAQSSLDIPTRQWAQTYCQGRGERGGCFRVAKQKPDINLIESLWKVLKTKVHTQKTSNLRPMATRNGPGSLYWCVKALWASTRTDRRLWSPKRAFPLITKCG